MVVALATEAVAVEYQSVEDFSRVTLSTPMTELMLRPLAPTTGPHALLMASALKASPLGALVLVFVAQLATPMELATLVLRWTRREERTAILLESFGQKVVRMKELPAVARTGRFLLPLLDHRVVVLKSAVKPAARSTREQTRFGYRSVASVMKTET